MTRRQWTGLAGVAFGGLMLAGLIVSGTTPDSTGSGAVERYTKYWNETSNQDAAALGSILITYACVSLALFAAGLRGLLSRLSSGLAPAVLALGAAAAAALAAGAMLINAPGIAASEYAYTPTGEHALLLEGPGYYVAATAMMMAGAMAVCFSLANRVSRVVPQWTMIVSALLGLVALGSIFVAWIAFMLLPVWSVVIGVSLLTSRGPADDVVAEGQAASA